MSDALPLPDPGAAPLSGRLPAADRRQRQRPPFWALACRPLALLIAAPLLAVLAAAAVPAGAVWHHIATTTLPEMLANSAALAVLVGLMVASAGTLSAWLVTACQFRGRALLEVALLLPMAMPAYVCG